jgi:hypothetical protein
LKLKFISFSYQVSPWGLGALDGLPICVTEILQVFSYAPFLLNESPISRGRLAKLRTNLSVPFQGSMERTGAMRVIAERGATRYAANIFAVASSRGFVQRTSDFH